jgi:uncharacterized protein
MMALARREFHLFQAAGRDFLYLVPSAAVFALDEATSAVLNAVSVPEVEREAAGGRRVRTEEEVVQALAGRFDETMVRAAISELLDVRAIGYEQQPDEVAPRMLPMMPFPLTTMVSKVTTQCNLA